MPGGPSQAATALPSPHRSDVHGRAARTPGPPHPELRIVESRVYRGPNVWSYDPAVHLLVDLGILEHYPTSRLPGFTEALLELLPGIGRHTCSRGHAGGFVERMTEGTWLGHVCEHVALQLQQEAGHDMRRGKTRMVRGSEGRYNVIYGYTDETVGLSAGQLAARLVNHLVSAEEGFDFAAELDLFLRRAERAAFGPSTQAILEAASRDIPFMRLNSASLVQLGQGVYAQRIRATMTSKTAALAVDIASDKELTAAARLRRAPGAAQRVGPHPRRGLQVAREIGYPVVVKPLDGNHGRGVRLNLRSDDDVRAAFPIAQAESRRGYLVVETFVTGKDHRRLIVGGRMQAIAERVPAHVVGTAYAPFASWWTRPTPTPARGGAREGPHQDPHRRDGDRGPAGRATSGTGPGRG